MALQKRLEKALNRKDNVARDTVIAWLESLRQKQEREQDIYLLRDVIFAAKQK